MSGSRFTMLPVLDYCIWHYYPITLENTVFQPVPKCIKAAVSSKLALGV